MPLLPNSVEAKSAPFLARVENVLDQLDTLKARYMNEAKGLRGDIKQIYDDAKDADVPTLALKGLVKWRLLEKKQDAIANTFAAEEVSEYELLVEALGEFSRTELGQAALDLAGGGDGEEDRDLRPRFVVTSDEVPQAKPTRERKAKAAEAPAPGPEEAAALAEIEADGIAAASGATAH